MPTFIPSFIHPFHHSFIRLFIYSFICPFIHSSLWLIHSLMSSSSQFSDHQNMMNMGAAAMSGSVHAGSQYGTTSGWHSSPGASTGNTASLSPNQGAGSSPSGGNGIGAVSQFLRTSSMSPVSGRRRSIWGRRRKRRRRRRKRRRIIIIRRRWGGRRRGKRRGKRRRR